jgi:hypothetical protein
MTPSDPKTPTETESLRTLIGAMQALRVVMAKLEQRAAAVIFNNPDPKRHHEVNRCVIDAARAFLEALKKCEAMVPKPPPQPSQGGIPGSGPDCGPGFHEEFGNCVPDN